MRFFPEVVTRRVIQLPAYTDNRANGYAVKKLLKVKFPLASWTMEFLARVEKINARTDHRGVAGELEFGQC